MNIKNNQSKIYKKLHESNAMYRESESELNYKQDNENNDNRKLQQH